MPEIKELPYLTGEDVGAETVVLFLEPHVDKTKEETGLDKDTAEIMVQLPDGSKKNWTMNKTSQRQLVKQLGANSDSWVGKTATLFTKAQSIGQKDVTVIYVRGQT